MFDYPFVLSKFGSHDRAKHDKNANLRSAMLFVEHKSPCKLHECLGVG